MRERLSDRRSSITTRIEVEIDSQNHTILLTVGFREIESVNPAEVFSSSFKTGQTLNAIISDACVLMSRLYQHGDTPQQIADCLSQPPSLVGQIAVVVASMAPKGENNDGPQ